MNTTEKAQLLAKAFGKHWLAGRLQISSQTLDNRIRGSFDWKQEEIDMIEKIYVSPVNKVIN